MAKHDALVRLAQGLYEQARAKDASNDPDAARAIRNHAKGVEAAIAEVYPDDPPLRPLD